MNKILIAEDEPAMFVLIAAFGALSSKSTLKDITAYL